MLQIITGKFFDSNNVHEHYCEATFYSNYIFTHTVELPIGSIEFIEENEGIAKYLFKYTNRIEKGGILLRTGDHEIVKQFNLIFSFFFNCYSNIDKSNVEEMCRTEANDSIFNIIPSNFIPNKLMKSIKGNQKEIDEFNMFFTNILGLKRCDFIHFIECINAYNNSIISLNYNIDLAYSLMVYTLESMSQIYKEFTPSWNDFNQDKRLQLEHIFEDIAIEKVDKIKTILLSDAHLKLQKRLLEFVNLYLNYPYFTVNAQNVNFALKKGDVNQVIINAYNIRSKYAHVLESMQKEMKYEGYAKDDTYIWENNVYLTYSGLVRICRYIINNYFNSKETVEKENINWREELPGILNVTLSEELWLGRTEKIIVNDVMNNLNGVLSVVQKAIITEKVKVDVKGLMKKFEEAIPILPKKEKVKLLVGYAFCNSFFQNTNLASQNYKYILDKNKELFLEDAPEMLLILLLTDLFENEKWTDEKIELLFLNYQKKLYKKNSFVIPKYLELLIRISIANLYSDKDHDKYNQWITDAILNIPGNYTLQKIICEKLKNKKPIAISELVEKRFYLSLTD